MQLRAEQVREGWVELHGGPAEIEFTLMADASAVFAASRLCFASSVSLCREASCLLTMSASWRAAALLASICAASWRSAFSLASSSSASDRAAASRCCAACSSARQDRAVTPLWDASADVPCGAPQQGLCMELPDVFSKGIEADSLLQED